MVSGTESQKTRWTRREARGLAVHATSVDASRLLQFSALITVLDFRLIHSNASPLCCDIMRSSPALKRFSYLFGDLELRQLALFPFSPLVQASQIQCVAAAEPHACTMLTLVCT